MWHMCLNKIYKNYSIVNGKYVIDFKSSGVPSFESPSIGLPCGNCPECWNASSIEWAVRCVLESKQHAKSCVLTLTYDDKHCDGELHKRDYQLFLKRLRKAIQPARIKYFLSGEYGDLRGRPHYHAVIFGFCPNDLVFFKKSKKGSALYNSKFIDKLWDKGYVTVDSHVDFKSCFYSAKYMQKALAIVGVYHKQQPFVAMSKGIALAAAENYCPLKDDYVYVSGKRYPIPRYFKKVAERNGLAFPLEVKRWIHPVYKYTDVLNVPLYMLKNSQIRKLREEKIAQNQAKWEKFYHSLNISAQEYWTKFNLYAKIRRAERLKKLSEVNKKCRKKNLFVNVLIVSKKDSTLISHVNKILEPLTVLSEQVYQTSFLSL